MCKCVVPLDVVESFHEFLDFRDDVFFSHHRFFTLSITLEYAVAVYKNNAALILTKRKPPITFKLNSLRMSKKYIQPSTKRGMSIIDGKVGGRKGLESNFVPVAT